MKIGIIIPARLNSKRLPEKVLRKFGNKSMIEHVWFRAKIASPTSEIYITTDDKKIARECKAFGANIIMSSSKHSNGLSRIVEVSSKLKWDYFIVLQADELLVLPKNIKKLVNEIQLKKYYDVYCLISAVNIKDLSDENIVKCVTGRDQNIITFFRKNWFTSNSKKICTLQKKSVAFMQLVNKLFYPC